MYEVELKFPLSDPAQTISRLRDWGATPDLPVEQVDVYFRHPGRDFAVTNEALRLRSVGERNWLTYKGPVVDRLTKTRRELETRLADGAQAAADMAETLKCLGFEPVQTVRKRRTVQHLTRDGRPFEIAVDDVEGVGTYLEIETLAAESALPLAQQAVLQLAAELELPAAERRSYLELVLERNRKNS
ncbi:MAG: class IV adenylate cyclase [Planctomycetaceae bacterium]